MQRNIVLNIDEKEGVISNKEKSRTKNGKVRHIMFNLQYNNTTRGLKEWGKNMVLKMDANKKEETSDGEETAKDGKENHVNLKYDNTEKRIKGLQKKNVVLKINVKKKEDISDGEKNIKKGRKGRKCVCAAVL